MSAEDEFKRIEPSDLRDLVMSMYDIQHTRIIIGNRLELSKNSVTHGFYEALVQSEDTIKINIEAKVKHFPIHVWLVKRSGIKHDMAAQLIGMIQDISKFDNISSLHSYCGYGVIKICNECGRKYIEPEDRPEWIAHVASRLKEQFDKKKGKKGAPPDFVKNATDMLCSHTDPETTDVAQRKVKGTLLDYNPKLKSLIWRYSGQFVKQGKKDIYRPLYEQFKASYAEREDLKAEIEGKVGGETKFGTTKGTGHVDNMAKRKMVKIFLAHFWAVWRELEGLSVTKPWIIDVGGHSKYIEAPGPTAIEIPEMLEKARENAAEEELKALEKLKNPKKFKRSKKLDKLNEQKELIAQQTSDEIEKLELMDSMGEDGNFGFGEIVA